MKELASYLTNQDAPSAGFSYGKFKDDPGDGSGSGAIVQTINDVWYGLEALAFKYMGGITDTDESESASDIMDSVETAIGVLNPNVSEYVGATVYGVDDHVMRYGLQFVSMVAANTGNDPFTNQDKWMPCLNRDNVMLNFRNGVEMSGGMEPVHNHRDALYRQYFGFGKYNFGGDSGVNYETFGVHYDGTVVTGNPTLVAIFDVGGGDEYHLLDVIAPDIVGTRTLIDAKGRVAANVDGAGGNREAVGGEQEDQFQGHNFNFDFGGAAGTAFGATGNAVAAGTSATATTAVNTPNDDGVNGTPRVGLETQMKNYSKGIDYVIVMLPLP